MTDLPAAVDAYALFRRCYRQRTKPWEGLAAWEQEGWREFFDAAARTIIAAATAAERQRIRQLAAAVDAFYDAPCPDGIADCIHQDTPFADLLPEGDIT